MARYRKIYPRLWQEEAFQSLSPMAQFAFLYCLTGPNSNSIGTYHCTKGEILYLTGWYARSHYNHIMVHPDQGPSEDAYDLENSPEEEILATGYIKRYGERIWIPTWWKWNCPDNPSVAKHIAKQFEEVSLEGFEDEYMKRMKSDLPKPIYDGILEGMAGTRAPRRGKTPAPPPPAPTSPPYSGSSEQEEVISNKEKNKTPPTPPRGEGISADEVVNLWNSQENLPQIRSMSSKRSKNLRARARDEFWRANWKAALAKIPTIPGLLGENDKGWTADIDWFLRPDTVTRIVEGKYDKWGQKQGPIDFLGIVKRHKEKEGA